MMKWLIVKLIVSMIVANVVCARARPAEMSRAQFAFRASIVGLACGLMFETVYGFPTQLAAMVGAGGFITTMLTISGLVIGFIATWVVTAILLRRLAGVQYDASAPLTSRIVLIYIAVWIVTRILIAVIPGAV